MHFKYSSILNQLFVCFMYGIALPMLFPVAFLGIVVLYIVEIVQITYVYKKPPAYDEKLNNAALSMMKWAPFLMLVFGYWLIGNK